MAVLTAPPPKSPLCCSLTGSSVHRRFDPESNFSRFSCLASLSEIGGTANVSQRPGDLFVRLVGTRGLLDPRGSPPTSPAFRLALDIDRTPPTYRSCSGGGNSWLRISYHDMILAWAQVPHFCVYGNRGVGSVGTLEVEAKADASVLREEVRNLLWSEIQVVGKVEFDVDGEVAGLGYLRCKFFIMEDKAADVPKSLCILRQ
uniref:Uncharacterized protein n=1 Tax=Aegilops tauschii TaxID=37682 RepID=M8BZM9_AEGTA